MPDSKGVIVRCWSAHNNRSMQKAVDVHFTVAEDGEQCCITQLAISQSHADFLPEDQAALFEDRPELNKATIIQCKHTFHALSLMYHFVRNCMSCPVCRQGATDKTISMTCFKGNKAIKTMHARARTMKREERDREVEEETRMLIENMGARVDIIEDFYAELLTVVPSCSFYFFDPAPETHSLATPSFTFTCPMRLMDTSDPESGAAGRPHENMLYQAGTPSIRRISATMCGAMNDPWVILHITARNPYTQTPLLVARTPYIRLREVQNEGTTVQDLSQNSGFHLSTFTDETTGHVTLQSVAFEISNHGMLYNVLAG